jgi:AraC-like DNA-binding protein
MPPKLYCRLQRFQKALAIAAQQQRPGWGILAATCGYFDQAHLIRDFRAFSGISPTEYVRGRNEHQNHVRVPG